MNNPATSRHGDWRLIFGRLIVIDMSEMNELFILQNQDRLFFGKQKEWLDGRDLGSLYKTPHKDEAINQMVEASSRDYTQRIKVLSCGVNEKGLPVIDVDLMPPPQPKIARSAIDKTIANIKEEVALVQDEDIGDAAASDGAREPDVEADDPQSSLL